MPKKNEPALGKGELILYQTEDGKTRLEVRLQDETVWLSQKLMAELFQTSVPNINMHINNIFEEGELEAEPVIKDFLITAADGKKYQTKFFNLDVIISVGYRIKSHVATRFRQWATQRLREYIIKGFTLDDDRLKEGVNIGSDYFDEMLERIRDIRSSEKRFYQKIRDIYKLAADYDPRAEETLEFFSIVQNKLHFSISHKTEAEIIAERADSSKPNMGLTSWKGSKVRKGDVTIAKNYLNEEEMEGLNRIVNMYLDFAEDQAKRHRQIFMKNWRAKLDAFLQLNERDILTNPGKVSKAVADSLAIEQYERFYQHRLAIEAKEEALADDEELRHIESVIESKKKRGRRDE
ncbi:MAG: virulence RhuM family protein [Thermodesulfobacteriota bacterium]